MTHSSTGATPEQLLRQWSAANEALLQGWEKQVAGSMTQDFSGAYQQFVHGLAKHSEQWTHLQQDYLKRHFELWTSFLPTSVAAKPALDVDRRFASPEWGESAYFDYLRRSYLLTAEWLNQVVEQVDMDADTKQRMLFFVRQYIDAMAPSNFLATNPEALKQAVASHGESLTAGLKNFLADVQKGRISMTDESVFKVGENLAISEGAVVFRNELIELIQYSPLTAQVFDRPLLMVPPCINKFYIMDLEPENSFVRFAVESGHTVFMVSWRNVKAPQGKLTWDDYLELGVLAAIDAARAICKADKINVLGFCVGGTLVASALAVLAKRNIQAVESITLMTTLLEFSDVGDIRAYVDENVVRQREQQLARGGIMPGKDLAMAFSSLRANDLIWNYVVSNYLKGKSPPPFNLLYWNGDSTNLPGPMYAYYLRNFYYENRLIQPNALKMCGESIDIGAIRAPTYVFAAREDHIVPWKSGFASTQFLGGKCEFVLGASGHIAGAMNPASKNKRNFWAGGQLGKGPDQWLESAHEIGGSWWKHWAHWLAGYGGRKRTARKALGNAQFPALDKAPGRYVLEHWDTK